ncbi:LAETG motif-containing sortase-dependent surface protein [Streptomyces sp. TR06-5]|uniref:LAETG motif-containing sortase-dependent surface protein n=1 Tax=unclassified Streptomyces TaxID=2593676 RepID=UPI0039A19FFC
MSSQIHRRRGAAVLGAAGIALAGSVLFAAPASAHTPNWDVTCDSVSVNLKYYARQGNSVTITAGGDELLNEEFGRSFEQSGIALPEHTEPLEVHLKIDASDDDRYDVEKVKTSPVCEGQEEPEPTPSETPSEEPEPTPSETPETEPSQSTSEPAPEPSESTESPAPTDLAETGASSNAPLIAGIAAAGIAVGGGLLVVARKRRSSQG